MAGSLKTTLPRAHDPFPGSDASEGWHMIQRRGFRRGRGVASAWEAGMGCSNKSSEEMTVSPKLT